MLFCNTDEGRAMLGDDMASDTEGMARALCQRGAASTVVTDARGICFVRQGEPLSLRASRGTVVDTSGAGTSYGRLMNYDYATSLRIGLNAAAMTIGCEDCNHPELSVDAVTRGLSL
jgi:sugar/nucleoside kinase (ribokinase family)